VRREGPTRLGAHGSLCSTPRGYAWRMIVEDTVFANVAAYMWACQYGLALFENRVNEGLNHNVVIEVGAMVMAGRRTALLKDTTAPNLPTDFVGHNLQERGVR
jgi:hypothetical protein